MRIFTGPLQGYTDAAWRAAHHKIIGGVDSYFTPFVRVEKGEARAHDVRDVASELNSGVPTVAQIIFGSAAEFRLLCDKFSTIDIRHINLNMGCPFPPQMQRCRGAAMVANATVLDEVLRAMADYPQVTFSVKMRLGREQPDEWRSTIDIINRMPLEHVTIHPRTGRQQYKGELHMDEFEHILEICEHPIVFNGDITSPAEAKAVVERFPGLHALMIGRGLLARPTLAWEINNHELSEDEQLKAFLAIHDELYAHYSHVLSGDAHLLAKMRAVCEYAEDLLGHKVAKAVRKAKSAEQYLAGISALRRRVG